MRAMPWLVRGDRVLASLVVADTPARRIRALRGRSTCDGALLIWHARSVHTIGMRFAVDVAHLDADLRVVRTTRMARHRLGRPIKGARAVLEAEAGSFERWSLAVGDELAVRVEDGGRPVGESGHR